MLSVLILGLSCIFATSLQAGTPTVKPKPVGVYCLEPFQETIDATAGTVLQQDPVWTQSNVSGVAIRCSWGAVEPSEGQYNFSLFDAALALAKQYKKKVSFSVTAGTFTPDWVYDAGAQPFDFTQNDGTPGEMPEPWDPIYQSKWLALVRQMGQLYDNRPELSYVAMGGLGPQMETYFAQQPADIVTFDAMDGQSKWLMAGETIEGQYAQSFPTTHLLFAIAPPTTDLQGTQTMDQLVSLCAYNSPQQFGIRSDGLRPNYSKKGAVGTLMTQYANKLTTGFQMSLPAVNQSLTLWFTVAESMKADFVEVYHGNCEDPTQSAAITKANSKLGN